MADLQSPCVTAGVLGRRGIPSMHLVTLNRTTDASREMRHCPGGRNPLSLPVRRRFRLAPDPVDASPVRVPVRDRSTGRRLAPSHQDRRAPTTRERQPDGSGSNSYRGYRFAPRAEAGPAARGLLLFDARHRARAARRGCRVHRREKSRTGAARVRTKRGREAVRPLCYRQSPRLGTVSTR